MARKRSYRSELRTEQAQRTRARIRKAARELFERQGFAATTVAEIAARAGVSTPTVYGAYDSKAGIVSAMLEEMEESIDIDERLRGVFAEPDPRRQLGLFVAAHCALFFEGAAVLRAAIPAREDPAVAMLAERGDTHRRRVIDGLVAGWSEAGALHEGLTPGEAAERMWLLTTTETFLTAVDRLAWSPDRYESWLAEVLEREVFGPA
jgi:AcrR family transcriptional regulator